MKHKIISQASVGILCGAIIYLFGNSVAIAQEYIEKFESIILVDDGISFGQSKFLTFETFRNGTFIINDRLGYAHQISESYRDSAIIRSTQPLIIPYKISVIVGEIDYGLANIEGLGRDPEYREGPKNENGCYLISITDTNPSEHHTNDWWHEHRKMVIDVDNNIWGHGMPNPIFMVYFDTNNELVAYDGQKDEWQFDWKKGMTYDPQEWYRVTLERTQSEFIYSIYDEQGRLLKTARVDTKEVWHTDPVYPDYFVIGDPHENYYQGSFKIQSIHIEQN